MEDQSSSIRHNTLWDALDQHRAFVQVLGTMLAFGVVVIGAGAYVAILFSAAGRQVPLYVVFGIVAAECAWGVFWQTTRTRRGAGVLKGMQALASPPGSRPAAEAALAQAAIATGHADPPCLFTSPTEAVNAAILGRPGTTSWVVVATEGMLRLPGREQLAVYVNLIARRSHRLLSWPLANLILMLTAMVLGIAGLTGPIFTRPRSMSTPFGDEFVRVCLCLAVVLLALWVYRFIELRIQFLTDENTLLHTKDPEGVLSGLIKASRLGSRIPECENCWHYLFWRFPQGTDQPVVDARIRSLESVTGAATVGVRARAEAVATTAIRDPSASTASPMLPTGLPKLLVISVAAFVVILGVIGIVVAATVR